MHRRYMLAFGLVLLAITARSANATEPTACTVTIGLGTSEPLTAIQLTIDYSQTSGTFVGVGAQVECIPLSESATVSAHDSCSSDYVACQSGPGRRLAIALLANHPEGFVGPVEIARCAFSANTSPSSMDFGVTGVTASNLAFADADPVPLIDVLSVDCDD
ncbi:MAG TPA: hypothetical protein VEL28_04755 [Candidatus Binatia bacterium]|nr:hypothetical protein [Candidatus Binatia bacterium]